MLYPIENKVREVKNLNGIWNFKVDTDNVGFSEKWYETPLTDTMPMAVPASYNDVVTDEKIKEHVGYVWYERSFVIPNSWNNERMVIRFGSATHHAVVWLDGQEIVQHKGGFLPFEADITELIENSNLEQHRLTVALSNVLDWTCIPCGEIIEKSGSQYPEGFKFQETYFDFYNYSGLHRPVKIYTTPKKYIKDIVIETEVKGLNSNCPEKLNVTIDDYNQLYAQNLLPTAASATVKVSVESTDALQMVKIIDEQGNVVAQAQPEKCDGEDKYYVEVELEAPTLWNPDCISL